MNILITGGAGFIGSHLSEVLLGLGHNVYVIDNFIDFYPPSIKRNNIQKCLTQYVNPSPEDNKETGKYLLLEGDLRDPEFLKKVFSSNNFDLVVHLAAMAGVRPSIDNARLFYDVNVIGTLNLLEKCREVGISGFIFASSSSVYGNNRKIPFAESDPVDNPISPYAASKKAGELMCHCYHHLYDISMVCLRYFTVYGPRQRPDLAIHKFAGLMLKGRRIPVYGDIDSRRDYTYIDDIIDGTVKAIDYVLGGKVYDIFNLGESEPVSLSRMIKTLEEHLNITASIENYPHQKGDVRQTYASLEKSKRLLGYKPTVKFDEGVRLFVQWLKDGNI